MAINANASGSNYGLGIQGNSSENDSRNDVLGFAKRLLYEPPTYTNGGLHSPPPRTPTRSASGSGSGKRPLFTRDHSRASSSSSIRSLRSSQAVRESANDDQDAAAGSAGPSSPLYGQQGETTTASPRRRPLFSSTNSFPRRQTTSASTEEKRALAKLVGMYEELSQHLTHVLSQQDDLETNLKIARSNLALAENHAEALEDTIKRQSIRFSNGGGNMSPVIAPPPPPIPSATGGSNGSRPSSVTSGSFAYAQRVNGSNLTRSPNLSVINTTNLNPAEVVEEEDGPGAGGVSATNTAPSPRLGGFWRKRPTFGASTGGGGASSSTTSPNTAGGAGATVQRMSYDGGTSDNDSTNNQGGSLMRKPSFGMLRSSSANVPATEKERTQASLILAQQNQLAQLQHSYSLLSTEHTKLHEAHSSIKKKYASLQEEIENLSVSLFEEANNMVSEERRVNGFLGQQLEKAKEEVEDLQRQLEGFRSAEVQRQSISAFSSSSSAAAAMATISGEGSHSRRASDVSSLSASLNARSRTSTLASTHSRRRSVSSLNNSSHHKRRRSSTLPSLDAIDALVASSPRRASRDMAAAAMAVKALAQRERESMEGEIPPLPRVPSSASGAGFARVHEEEEVETEDAPKRESRSAPQTATNVAYWPSSSYGNSNNNRDSQNLAPERPLSQVEQDNSSQQQQQSSNKSRWFSFGSLKRKSPAIGSLSAFTTSTNTAAGSVSPTLPSPNLSTTSETNTISPGLSQTPQFANASPFTSSFATLKTPPLSSASPQMQQPETPQKTLGLPRSPSYRSIAESIIPLPTSPPRSRTMSARSMHGRTTSSSSLKSPIKYRPDSPASIASKKDSRISRPLQSPPIVSPTRSESQPPPAPRDRFFASSIAAASTSSSSAKTSRQRADTSQSQQSQLSTFTSMKDLHSMLDEVANDLKREVNGDSTVREEELPFSRSMAVYQVRPELGRRRTPSWKGKEREFEFDLEEEEEEEREEDQNQEERGGVSRSGDYHDSGTLRRAVSPSSPPPKSPPRPEKSPQRHRPSSSLSDRLDYQMQTRNRSRNPKLQIQTAPGMQTRSYSDQQHQQVPHTGDSLSPTSPFPMPTPPPFKRFPSNEAYRIPLPASAGAALPPSSVSLLRKDSLSAGPMSASSTSSLSKFWDVKRAAGGFPGLERQNSGMSGTGSVVDDLDSLMQSIDAMNESLGGPSSR